MMADKYVGKFGFAAFLAALLVGTAYGVPAESDTRSRAKRQLPMFLGGGPFGGGGGPGGGMGGGGFGIPGFPLGLGILADNRKCCCEFGVPPECLDKCIVRPGVIDQTPPMCEFYSQVYGFTCFGQHQYGKGECAADYSQPPPRAGNCPAVLLEADDKLCQSDGCHTDYSCVNREDSKCCRSTCPDRANNRNAGKLVCMEGVQGDLTPCEMHRHRVLDQIIDANAPINRSAIMAWLPECTRRQVDPDRPAGPSYKSTQCIAASQTCFCVNETTGEELPHSRYERGETPINCSLLTSVEYSPCHVEVLLILEQHASIKMPDLMHAVESTDVWVPECLHESAVEDGRRTHRHMQCDTNSGFCWCTTNGGKAILDSMLPIGHAIFANQCQDYRPTRCEREVALTVHDFRIQAYGLRNGSQHFRQRSFYESLPNFFIPRCVDHDGPLETRVLSQPQSSYEEVQFTIRQFERLSERFCVDPRTGFEIPGSRLGAGEHRFVRSTPAARDLCHKRSHCENEAFNQLRHLRSKLQKRGTVGKIALVNRELAKSMGEFVPACLPPSANDAKISRPGLPLSGSLSQYGYAPRQCAAFNHTCWCVYRDGVAVDGTRHFRNQTMDCSSYESLCLLPGRIRVQAPSSVLRAAVHRCPTSQVCRDVGEHIGVGLCQEQRIPASKNCHNVQHGARTLVRSECRLCQCQNGRLDSCIQLSRSNCSSAEPCFIRASNGHVVSLGHGMRGSVDCRQCVCNNGKYDCKAGNCSQPTVAPRVDKSCLPPESKEAAGRMCAPNGRTYSSAASALKCAGFQANELMDGACPQQNPCRDGVCTDGFACVPSPRQCLVAPCLQYICVKKNATCDPDVDEDNTRQACFEGEKSHESVCHGIVRTQHALYLGSCDKKCSGLVCGTDKVTYESECHAHGSSIPMDYRGSCRKNCKEAECPSLPSGCTVMTHLPDQCCPFCGGGAQLSISKPIARALAGAGHDAGNDVTSIVAALNGLLQGSAAQNCMVHGHVTHDDVLEVRVETRPGRAMYGLSCFQGVQSVVQAINSGRTQQMNAITAAIRTASLQTARTGFSSAASMVYSFALLVCAAVLAALLA